MKATKISTGWLSSPPPGGRAEASRATKISTGWLSRSLSLSKGEASRAIKQIAIFLFLLVALNSSAQQHPSIMLTKKNVESVREGIKKYPLLKSSYADVKKTADKALASLINVPTPADGGGGITHEQH